jgi:hypothetical protein
MWPGGFLFVCRFYLVDPLYLLAFCIFLPFVGNPEACAVCDDNFVKGLLVLVGRWGPVVLDVTSVC